MKRSRRLRRVVTALLAVALALPAVAGAAAWDGSPLEISPAGSSPGAPDVAVTSDGASWVIWTEDPESDAISAVVARRVSADGALGERRVLATDGTQYGAVAIAAVSATDVRVAYVTGPGLGTTVQTRRLAPADTAASVTLYDKDVTDDGNVGDNGAFSEGLAAHAAPGGGAWIRWTRTNNGLGRSETRYVDGAGDAGSLVTIADAYGTGAETTPDGSLVVAYPSGAQGQVVATRIATSAGAPEAPIVLRPSSPSPPPFFSVQSTDVTVDPAGIATAGWYTSTATAPGSYPEVRRFDAGATPIVTQGGGPASLIDGMPGGYVGYLPLLAADPEGDVLAAWQETTSWTDESDTIVRELGAGSLPGTIGPRLQVDGPKPEGSSPFAVVPESASQTRVIFAGHHHGDNVSFCRASRIGDGGVLIGTETIAVSCSGPAAARDPSGGLSVAWTASGGVGQIRMSRWVEEAPTCTDGAPAQVQAGESVSLTLPCDGWRPLREAAVPAPALGTLGAIDQSTGEVTYSAGAVPGSDEVRFRAVNAAGASVERKLTVTVTPAPQQPAAPPAPAAAPVAAPPADSTAPTISEIRVVPRRIRAGSRGGPLLSFRLSEPVTVRIRVQVRAQGRRSGGKCRTARKLQRALRRKPRCQTWLTVAATTRKAPAGTSSLRLRGSRGRALPRGAYRALVSATDAAGNRSREAHTVFDVTR